MASEKLDVDFALQEMETAKKYHEQTGRNFWKLSPTQRRKLIENYVEDSVKTKSPLGSPRRRT